MGILSFTLDTLPVPTSPTSRIVQKGSLQAGNTDSHFRGGWKWGGSWLRALRPRTATSASCPSVSSPSSPDSQPPQHLFLHCLSLALCPSGEKHLTLKCRGAGLPGHEGGIGRGQLRCLCFQEMGEGFLLSPPSQRQGSKEEEEFKSKIQVLKNC